MKVQKIVLFSGRSAAAHTRGGGMPGSTRLRPAAIAAFLLFALGAGAQAPAAAGDAVGPGCDPARPAVAYRAGLGVVTSHQGNRPIPCAVVTGSTMETAPVGVSQDGTLVYAPQSTGAAVAPAVFTSKDDGATWQVQTPTLQPGTGSAIPWMHLDPQTNRIWFAMIGPRPSTCPSGTYAQVTWSDDEGHSWHTPPGDPANCRQLQGGMSIVEGPAPKGQPQPVGYPHSLPLRQHLGRRRTLERPLLEVAGRGPDLVIRPRPEQSAFGLHRQIRWPGQGYWARRDVVHVGVVSTYSWRCRGCWPWAFISRQHSRRGRHVELPVGREHLV